MRGWDLSARKPEKSESNGHGAPSGDIKTKATTIYFYDDVRTKSILELNNQLRLISNDIKKNAIDGSSITPIHLRINSFGGSLLDGLAAVNTIYDIQKNLEIPIYTYVEGYAASAATLISIMGKRRFMYKYSHMLIHQLSSWTYGNFEQLKDDMTNNERFMKVITNLYLDQTNINKETLSEILKHDLYFDAKTCLNYKLVDEIL